jgi:hypothetical protein
MVPRARIAAVAPLGLRIVMGSSRTRYSIGGMRQKSALGTAILCLAALGAESDERRWEQAHDKLELRRSAELRRDVSAKVLKIPKGYPEPLDFDVARVTPAIDFGIVQGLKPEFLSEVAAGERSAAYGGWGNVSRGPDGCFYFAIGNHMAYNGGTAYVIRYDPAKKEQSIVVDTRKLVGWGADDWGDGKIHGDLDIAPNGDLWMLTFYGPRPSRKDWEKKYRGGWLLYANVLAGKQESLGVPLEGDSWPYHNWDWERNLLFGAGSEGKVLVYDTAARRLVYGGAPPDGIQWHNRAILIDRSTGLIYTTDASEDAANMGRFVRYTRRNHRFERSQARTPENPVTGRRSLLRAYTRQRDGDGAFWCFDHAGTMFRFWPDEDRVEAAGVNWGKSGKYTTNIASSPGGRYLYYLPGADRKAWEYGTPVVQYDTRTGRKKVIAFLHDFYLERYGYAALGTYGLELDQSGESLFLYMDGRFTERGKETTGVRRPAMFHVHVPAAERGE